MNSAIVIDRQREQRPYEVRYSNEPPTGSDHVLASICHAERRAAQAPEHCLIDLQRLDGPAWEIWESRTPVTRGESHGLHYAHNAEVLFGTMWIPEQELAHIDRAVFHAYALIDGVLKEQGFPHWHRVWNYMGSIHQGDGDAERYRQFVAGRYKALALKSGFEHSLPAATAIGTHGEGLLVYLLASRHSGLQIENPRQVSAFRYPRQYGPRSPSFSRAMLMSWADRHELMISGTASVVGHQTRHAGDAMAQLAECLRNVDAVIARASDQLDAKPVWSPQILKLYVRDPSDAQIAGDFLRRSVEPGHLVVLHGDICREDLALEFEATYLAPR